MQCCCNIQNEWKELRSEYFSALPKQLVNKMALLHDSYMKHKTFRLNWQRITDQPAIGKYCP